MSVFVKVVDNGGSLYIGVRKTIAMEAGLHVGDTLAMWVEEGRVICRKIDPKELDKVMHGNPRKA